MTIRRAAGAMALAVAIASASPATADDLVLGPVVRSTLPGCDAPTPVGTQGGPVYSNVSDCTPKGGREYISSGWARVDGRSSFIPSGLTTYGTGSTGRKLSGAVLDDGVLALIQRNITKAGGLRVGRSPGVAKPTHVTWSVAVPEFGWAMFSSGSPDSYVYVAIRDTPRAYKDGDKVALARVPKGKAPDLASWQLFAGTPDAPAWVPWAQRAARKPILVDPTLVNRPSLDFVRGCWTMAVTMPPPAGARGGSGVAVYTSSNPYGPWRSRYRATANLGETVRFPFIYPGRVLTSEGDRFVWRSYTMPAGC